MVAYKTLNTTNPGFDPDHIAKMRLLYEGGYQMMRNAELFLQRLSIEKHHTFSERKQCASYLPYLSQFVNHFASNLYSDDVNVVEAADSSDPLTLGDSTHNDPFYKQFAADADNQGTSLHNYMHRVSTESLYLPQSFVGVDFAASDVVPETLAEEEALGLSRAYLYEVDPTTVVDWKINQANQKFEWVKVRNDVLNQPDPLAPPTHTIQFRLCTLSPAGTAVWRTYESAAMPLNRQPRPNDDLPLTTTVETSFREIPLFAKTITDGLHIGNKLGPICEELFQRRSFLVSNMNKTCISIPVVFLGPDIGGPGEGIPNPAGSDPNRGQSLKADLENSGYTVLGDKKNDDVKMVESMGTSHGLVDKQLNELIEKMHELIGQMATSVANNSKALGRSADSKGEDRHATEVLLSAYSKLDKDFIKEIYSCVSDARGEDVVWSVNGLSTFVEEDRNALINELTLVAGTQPLLQLLPSPTLHKKYLLRAGLSLVGECSEEEERQIQTELSDAIDAEEHMPPDPIEMAQQMAQVVPAEPGTTTAPEGKAVGGKKPAPKTTQR